MKGRKFFPLLVIAAGLLAYQNSFTGPFIYDDEPSILDNPTIRHLWPIWQCLSPPHRGGALTVEGRPLINLSLAINYAVGGYNVWGYHALNLTAHILAGLTLLGVVRRTLLQPPLRQRFGAAANELALAVAVLWTVHPLQTESVTYIIQRAESIMGLFYLLTLYCFIRGVESPLVARSTGDEPLLVRSTRDEPRARLWYGLCVGACALGMASKNVMVSAPLMVLLYDRAFVSRSFRLAWQQRWALYLGLAATWVLLGFLQVSAGSFAYVWTWAQRADRWQYLATQPGVILYYLRLSVWPSPLCLRHPWPMASTWRNVLPPAVVLISLMAASAWASRRNTAWGFVGAWFFLILAPSSSLVPLPNDLVYEHRMYLSLAVVVSLVVMGLYTAAGRQSLAVLLVAAIALGILTWRRNQDYRSEVAFWGDAAAKFPNSPAAHYGLGVALDRAGKIQAAVAQYEQALQLDPTIAKAHYALGTHLGKAGHLREAIGHLEQAVQINPNYADAHYNLAKALMVSGKAEEAIGHYEQALRLNPNDAEGRYNLGNALLSLGQLPEATAQWEEAVRIKPDYADAHHNLGTALAQAGRLPEAVEQFSWVLRITPDDVEAHYNLGVALEQAGKPKEAIGHYEQALRIKPNYAGLHYNLGVALEQVGRVQEAIGHYEQALRIKPDYAEAQNSLARLRAAQ